jgi:hypothetical protein
LPSMINGTCFSGTVLVRCNAEPRPGMNDVREPG